MLLPDVLDALKARLETIDGLTVTTDPAATVVPPMAVVDLVEVDYNESFGRGGARITASVEVFVSTADNPEGQLEARRYLSPHGDDSVRAAVEATTDGVNLAVSVRTGTVGTDDRTGQFYVARFEVRAQTSNPDY